MIWAVYAALVLVLVAALIDLEKAPAERRAWYGLVVLAAIAALVVLALAS